LAAQVASAPASYIFTPIALGVASQHSFTITVPAGTTLGSISVLTLGAPNLDFTPVAAGTTCGPGVTGGTCAVEVQFQPTAPGRRLGMVVINDAGGNTLLVVSLDGVGIAPLASFAPGTMKTTAAQANGIALNSPQGIAFDGFGNLYIADQNANLVRKITPAGDVSTFAGNGTAGFAGDGGLATSAELNGPMAVVVDGAGYVYIADTGNNVVRIVNPAGIISTYAGQYYAPGSAPPPVCAAATNALGDGCTPTAITLNQPTDLVFCHAQNLHIADKGNNSVRTVMRTSNVVITQVGTGKAGYNGDTATVPGLLNTTAELNGPTGIDMDGANYIYVADQGNHIVRKTLLTGTTPNPISTVAGMPGESGYSGDGALATSAELSTPSAVKVDPAGDIYISDASNGVIRKVNASSGVISTFAGSPGGGSPVVVGDLITPAGLLLDQYDNLYIVDSSAPAVREIDLFDPPSLSFAAASGVASAEQDVTVFNTGNVIAATPLPLNLSQVALAPAAFSFTPDTTCTAATSLTPGESCLLGVQFTSATAGPVAGSVTLADNSFASGTQTIALNGTAASPQAETYTLAFPNPSVSIAAGSSGTATINLKSTNFAGTVSFVTSVTTTNGTASAVTATASPVTLAAAGAGASTLTIATTTSAANRTPAPPWKNGGLLLCALLLGLPFVNRRRSRILAVLLVTLAISMAGFVTACGGAGAGSSMKAARTYIVMVTPSGVATPAGAVTVTNPAPVSITVTVQ
jgi:hypothetical protein